MKTTSAFSSVLISASPKWFSSRPNNLDTLLRCRDPNDQMFLELALCGDADVLVTEDGDLLELAEGYELTIETPAEFKKRFD